MAIVETSAPTEERATAGAIISMVAGALIIVNGLVYFIFNSTLTSVPGGFTAVGIVYALGVLCLLFGILVTFGGWLMYNGKTTPGGVIVLVFGILSIFGGGGFFIGFILSIVGGALGLAGK